MSRVEERRPAGELTSAGFAEGVYIYIYIYIYAVICMAYGTYVVRTASS